MLHLFNITSFIKQLSRISFCLWIACGSALVAAGSADVIKGKITLLKNNNYRIDATVKHADTGWDHYANEWRVLDEKGAVLGIRTLHHPHVNEQPFTRSLTLSIPNNVKIIRIQAKDSVHGYGGKSISLQIP